MGLLIKNVRKIFVAMMILSFLMVLQIPAATAATTEWSEEIPQQTTADKNKPWTVKFSQNIEPKSVGAENVKIIDKSGKLIPVNVQVVADTIVITPENSYSTGIYYLYVGPGIQSVNKNEQKANIKFTFAVEDSNVNTTHTGIIQTVLANGIVVDGKQYTVDEQFKRLFAEKNADALADAELVFISSGTKIVEVQQLKLVNGGTVDMPRILDGSGDVITGNIIIDGDYYEVNNLTIQNLDTTDSVQESFQADGLIIKGKLKFSEQARNLRSSLETDRLTRMKVVFKDSTVAYIEIGKKNMYFAGIGSTKVTSMTVTANADIAFNKNVIVPTINISKGVTRIDLNATIASVVIESDDNIQITGSGDFESVTITTDKTVDFATVGTIGSLNTESLTGNIQLNEKLAVSNIKLPYDKTANEVISNFEIVKDKIKQVNGEQNPDYDPGKIPEFPDGHFAAGLLEVKDRYGYAELNIKNQGAHRVMYELVERRTQKKIAGIGQQVPATAIEYKHGDQFIFYIGYEVHVYLVDSNNKIIEGKNLGNSFVIFPRYEVQGSKLIVSAAFKLQDQPTQIPSLYIVSENFSQLFDNLSQEKWSTRDGVNTITLQMEQSVDEKYIGGSHFPGGGFLMVEGYPRTDKIMLNHLYFAYKLPINEQNRSMALNWTLRDITCGAFTDQEFDKRCTDHTITLYETNSISMKAYEQEFLANEQNLTLVKNAKQIIESVNERLKEKIQSYKVAEQLVNQLYKVDYHDSPYEDWLREGVTIEEIDKARVAVNALSDEFTEKPSMISRVNFMESLLPKF